MTILYVFIAILVLAFMIFIHELGHYTAGRLLGFKILDFSIGFGPAIFQFKRNGINYALRAVPLGGACRFYGEDDEPMDAVSFNSQKVWKRIITVLAGPVMNILLAYILSVILMMAYGEQQVRTYDNGEYAIEIVDFSADNSPAELAGIEKGDIILAIDGSDISNASESFEGKTERCSELIAAAPSSGVTITVIRDGAQTNVFVPDIYDAAEGRNMLGIHMNIATYFEKYGFFEAFGEAFDFLIYIVKTTFQGIGNMFKSGIKQGDVSGVVGTVYLMSEFAAEGFYYLLFVTILITMSLGIFNLIPFPALDGGRLVFMLIELIAGKPVPRKIEGIVHFSGMLLLFGLMAVVTIFDVLGIIRGVF